MIDPAKSDQEPITGAQPVQEQPKARRAFSRVRRELTEEEIAHPAVHRLILDEVDQLEQEVTELTDFRDRYYETDRGRAVLDEKLRQKKSGEVLQDAALGVGFLFIGLAPSAWTLQPYGYLTVAGGVILIFGALVAKGGAR